MTDERQGDPARRPAGVNLAILDDGREVHVDDITDLAEGQAVLDEIEAAAITIEGQLGKAGGDVEWRRRAKLALKRKRAVQGRIQRRLGELRRAARTETHVAVQASATAKVDAKRAAFVQAAHELLGHEVCTEIWTRAQEAHPEPFADGS